MKKITYTIILFLLLISINSCAGYKPIFNSSFQFEITDYLIEGDKKLGNQIYSRLLNHAKSNKNQEGLTKVYITIKTSMGKKATIKDSAGKILEYKISLNSSVKVENYLTKEKILNHTFIVSSSYKIQDQSSETKKLEYKSTENLLNQIYEELLIRLSEKM